MKRINGEANALAMKDAAKEYGVPKFILISVHDYNLPSFLLSSGYFTGKRKSQAVDAIRSYAHRITTSTERIILLLAHIASIDLLVLAAGGGVLLGALDV
ncbi:hypothetical protein IFM89_009285 [Coptis chinensis]|uniref:Uncharacterized protein n=1 Tax=Coptis chinensis TaxID=261450 RepID=A0A835LUV2_9MAGN|nr:hypothetical protein IFM89_009285 [Coptis chinensis]